MDNLRLLRSVAVLTLCACGSVAVAGPKDEVAEASSYDGLQKIQVKGIELAYARPGATLAGYTRVMVDPVEVAFDKNWKPQKTGTRMSLSSAEQQKIRADVAKIVYEAFVKELGKGGYTVVTAPGPEVLLVRPKIIDLYVSAPDVMTAGRSRTYTASAGRMTLVAELIDSDSGEVIARVLDREEARESGRVSWSSSVSNAAAADSAASNWARILRSALDKAKQIGAS
jgi:hypothetical protein